MIDYKRGNNAFLYDNNEIESQMQTFFHFDPKIMIQMNSPEHGQGVGCGVEDDE